MCKIKQMSRIQCFIVDRHFGFCKKNTHLQKTIIYLIIGCKFSKSYVQNCPLRIGCTLCCGQLNQMYEHINILYNQKEQSGKFSFAILIWARVIVFEKEKNLICAPYVLLFCSLSPSSQFRDGLVSPQLLVIVFWLCCQESEVLIW